MELSAKIKERTATICMVGLGYVGLPTAVFLAKKGFKVIGSDVSQRRVNDIMGGKTIFEDIGIADSIKDAVLSGRLEATVDTTDAVSRSDIILVTVPTPVTAAKEPDLSCVISASEDISRGLRKGQLVVLESTTYPGTTEEVMQPILEKSGLKAGVDFGLAYCPERYNPGDKEHTLEKVNRVVGGITPEWAKITRDIYATIIDANIKIVRNIKTAEAAKIVENIQRDVNIAIVNEFALIFERLGIDVVEVLDAASTKWNFLKFRPSPGVGGHCLPVDPYYLTHKAKMLGYDPQLILAGRSINNYMPLRVASLVVEGLNSVGKAVSKSKIALLGLSYKSNTGDLRESPSATVLRELQAMNGNIHVHEPLIDAEECARHLGVDNNSLDEALSNADCVVYMNAHDVLVEKIDLKYLKSKVKPDCVLVDTQYLFSPEDVKNSGLIYKAIGRGGV